MRLVFEMSEGADVVCIQGAARLRVWQLFARWALVGLGIRDGLAGGFAILVPPRVQEQRAEMRWEVVVPSRTGVPHM